MDNNVVLFRGTNKDVGVVLFRGTNEDDNVVLFRGTYKASCLVLFQGTYRFYESSLSLLLKLYMYLVPYNIASYKYTFTYSTI